MVLMALTLLKNSDTEFINQEDRFDSTKAWYSSSRLSWVDNNYNCSDELCSIEEKSLIDNDFCYLSKDNKYWTNFFLSNTKKVGKIFENYWYELANSTLCKYLPESYNISIIDTKANHTTYKLKDSREGKSSMDMDKYFKVYFKDVAKKVNGIIIDEYSDSIGPIIEDSQIPVHVIMLNLKEGSSISEIAENYQISNEDIQNAIDYVITLLKEPYISENVTVDESKLKEENLNKLQIMKTYKKDWNGYDSLPFSEESINLFISIIEGLKKQPIISPTGRDSLFMQYEMEDLSYLGFEVFKNNMTKVYIPKRNYDKAQEDNVRGDFVNYINTNVEKFYGDKIVRRT